MPDAPDPDLLAQVSERVARAEMARRIPDWDGGPGPIPPPGLPPLNVLAGRAFPRAVLERRLRFLRVMGCFPGDTLPPEATLEDHVAVGRAFPTGDPDAEETAALTAFFDEQADAEDPGWRDRSPRDPVAVTAWARVEATTLHGDRFFGRRRPGPIWTVVSGLVWRLAERKRRRWG